MTAQVCWLLGRTGSTALIDRLDVATRKFVKVGEIPENLGRVSWGEPGKTLYISRAVKGITNLWEYSLADGSLKQITFGPGPDRSPLGRSRGQRRVFREWPSLRCSHRISRWNQADA